MVGLFLALFHDRPLGAALDAAAAAGCEAVEIASTPASPHCRPAELLADRSAREAFASAITGRGLVPSALSCHGNPLHPDAARAAADDACYRDTVRLAAELGIGTVVTFSGCPGESERSLRPVWVTCSWPDEYPQTLRWQWEERVEPYWQEAGAFAAAHGVRIAIEPHPGFVVHNTRTALRLRAAGGAPVGVNFDPSHLFWQQIDPVASARALAGAVFHVHAKDTAFHDDILSVDGVLETRGGERPDDRAWIFRSVGDGHPAGFWRSLAAALREGGYDGALSIEHEDPRRSRDDGLARAVATLREALS